MKTRRSSAGPANDLRTRAEDLLRKPRREVARMPAEAVQKLVHELQVHQIELEMQNDELRRAQAELEAARDRSAELYDFAPSAYLTLKADGEILQANLCAGNLLGLERGRLIHQKFTRFLPAEAHAAFRLFCRQIFAAKTWQSTDLDLVNAKSKRLVVHAEAVREAAGQRNQCRFNLIDITERRWMEAVLRENEERLGYALEAASDGLWDWNVRTGEVYYSPRWMLKLGYAPEEVPASIDFWKGILHPEDTNRVAAALQSNLNGRTSFYECECRVRTKSGEYRWHLDRGRVVQRAKDGAPLRMVGADTDINERKLAEERVARLHRLQALFSGVDRAIVHLADRQQLLDEICRIAVERGGFKLAWIGMVSPEGVVEPVAQAGATGYLQGIRIATQEQTRGRGPVGTAIRENRSVVIEDVATDARMGPWQERALRFGLRYVAAFPIRIAGQTVGAFQVYAPQASFFDETELNLLTQVSDEISFALTARADAAARQRAEAALAESNQFNQQIIASATEGIIVYGRDLKYELWNPAMEKMSGRAATEVVGKHPLEVFPFLREVGVLEQVTRALAGKPCAPVDFQYPAPQTGSPGWALDSNAPLRNLKGEIIGVIGTVHDITERKREESAVRRSESNLANFFNTAPIGLQWLSASGIILRANQAELNLLGYSREEYLGHQIGEFHADPAVAAALLNRLAGKETVISFRSQIRRKDGALREVLIDANSLWEGNRFVHSSVFTRDITRRVELERELLVVSEREQRRIAQDLHDGLGQALAGTLYLTSNLQHTLAAKAVPEAQPLGRIVGLLDEAITQTRSLARGLHPVKNEPNGLLAALEELTSRTRSIFQVRCRFNCRRPLLIANNNTATHLYRIAQEAVTNAVKHGKPNRIAIGLTETANRIRLTVTDNGSGIAERRNPEGMGLRIMHHRAETLGASLILQKNPRGGTSVICTMARPGSTPRTDQAAATPKKN